MSATFTRVLAVFLLLLAGPGSFSQSASQPAQDKQAELASHIQKARAHLDQKRPDLAIPELQAAVAIDPESVEIQGNLGVLLYFQGKPADAIPHLRAAVERQAGIAKIQGLLGLAEVRTLDFAQGRKDLTAAFPLITEEKFKIEVGLELVGADTQTGELDEASTTVAQLRKAAPDNPEVLYAAYRTYSALSAESMLALSLAAPDSAQMHQMMAHEENRQGNISGAIAQLRKAIALDPHLPGVHFELAELLRSSQNDAVKKEAEAEYREALKENPQDEKAVLALATIDAERGNVEESYKRYSRAVELQPTDADAKLGLAKTLIAMKQTDRAMKLLEETVQLEPTNATAHYRLGTLYRQLGRTDDAKNEIELYKKYKDMKEKLRALYKELQIQANEIGEDEPEEKKAVSADEVEQK